MLIGFCIAPSNEQLTPNRRLFLLLSFVELQSLFCTSQSITNKYSKKQIFPVYFPAVNQFLLLIQLGCVNSCLYAQ